MVERKSHQTDPKKVKPGDVMAIIHYVKVDKINESATEMRVEPVDNPTNTAFLVQGQELITKALSADFFGEEVKVSMTEAAEKLVSSHNRPLTVCFIKQDGDDRVLRGRLLSPEPLLGRSHLEDLDVSDPKNRVRLVDHRTIKYLIVDGVKYVVKGKK